MSHKKERRAWEEIEGEGLWEDGWMRMLEYEMVHIKW
jgi:hypothetical protein